MWACLRPMQSDFLGLSGILSISLIPRHGYPAQHGQHDLLGRFFQTASGILRPSHFLCLPYVHTI